MTDILDRVFGPDPNPAGALPVMPTGFGVIDTHLHTWSERWAAGIQYWECTTNQSVCRAVRTYPPEEQ